MGSATSGSIRAWRTSGGNITIDTTHTAGGLIRGLAGRPHIEIERADLDDAIAALIALRAPARRPIERYARAAVDIPGTNGRIDGTVELGLHYDAAERPSAFRAKLIEVAEVGVRAHLGFGPALDADLADVITAEIDARIVGLWGDRPRFIEIWRGTSDDAEPLTQVYAPHGMPIGRAT